MLLASSIQRGALPLVRRPGACFRETYLCEQALYLSEALADLCAVPGGDVVEGEGKERLHNSLAMTRLLDQAMENVLSQEHHGYAANRLAYRLRERQLDGAAVVRSNTRCWAESA